MCRSVSWQSGQAHIHHIHIFVAAPDRIGEGADAEIGIIFRIKDPQAPDAAVIALQSDEGGRRGGAESSVSLVGHQDGTGAEPFQLPGAAQAAPQLHIAGNVEVRIDAIPPGGQEDGSGPFRRGGSQGGSEGGGGIQLSGGIGSKVQHIVIRNDMILGRIYRLRQIGSSFYVILSNSL